MAEKKEVVKDIRDQIGNCPTAGAVAKYLGVSRNTAKKFLQGVPAYSLAGDGAKHYLAIDLANHILDMEVTK